MADAKNADSPPGDEKYVIDGTEYTVHRLAQLFPLIEGPEYEVFVEDVARRGIASPVLRRGTEIIDGRNRVRAGLQTGKKIPFVDLAPGEQPAEAIMRANIHTRVLTASQRTVLSRKLRDAAPEVFDPYPKVPAPSAKAVPAAGGPKSASASGASAGASSPAATAKSGGKTTSPEVSESQRRRASAQAVGVSEVYQRQSDTVAREAPDLYKAVGAGQLTVRDAYAVRAEDPELRAKALDDVCEGRAKTAVAAVEARTGRAPKAQPPSQRRKSSAPEPDSSLPSLPQVGSGGGTKAPAPGPASAEPPAPAPADGKPPARPVSASPVPSVRAQPWATGAPHPDMLTPSFLLAGLRLVLGDIDLDPCSTADAQDHIAAGQWYTADQDGLKQTWKGSVWVFPPLDLAAPFAEKLMSELRSGGVGRGALLVPADLTTDWAQKLVRQPSFTGLVLETAREPYEVAGGSPGVRCPPMALYLFGIDALPAKYVESVGLWGRVLLNAPGQRG